MVLAFIPLGEKTGTTIVENVRMDYKEMVLGTHNDGEGNGHECGRVLSSRVEAREHWQWTTTRGGREKMVSMTSEAINDRSNLCLFNSAICRPRGCDSRPQPIATVAAPISPPSLYNYLAHWAVDIKSLSHSCRCSSLLITRGPSLAGLCQLATAHPLNTSTRQ